MAPLIVAHQFAPQEARRVAASLGDEVHLQALEGERAWMAPASARVLLTDQGVAGRLLPTTPRPAGWPGDLAWVHLRSTGVDRMPPWLFEVPYVTTSRGAQSQAIAEYVLAAILAFEKQIPEIWVRQRADWRGHDLGGLTGKTLGIVGFGHIGQAVAKLATAFGMQVVAARRDDRPLHGEGVTGHPLQAVLAMADHLLLATPLTEQTRNLVDADALAQVRPGLHLINVGRGAVLDTEALRVALDSGQVARASLDVVHPEPPPEGHWLYSHPGVVMSAHLSSRAPQTAARLDAILSENLAAYRAGKPEHMHGLVSRQNGY
tara:strand:+ start:43766 stop:44722 length:957 start_codon:yes stop_codon:yes gene_type:complete